MPKKRYLTEQINHTDIRNTNPVGFEIRVEEDPLLDGTHMAESIAYIVITPGQTAGPLTLESGTARIWTAQTISLTAPFGTTPLVFAAIQSEKGSAACLYHRKHYTA